jgi:hypothetical protein
MAGAGDGNGGGPLPAGVLAPQPCRLAGWHRPISASWGINCLHSGRRSALKQPSETGRWQPKTCSGLPQAGGTRHTSPLAHHDSLRLNEQLGAPGERVSLSQSEGANEPGLACAGFSTHDRANNRISPIQPCENPN